MKVRGAEGLYAQLRSQHSKGRKLNIGRLEASALSAQKLAMFHNGRPVSEEEYLLIAEKAINDGLVLQEIGLYMVELEHLKERNPTAYQAWVDSKFKVTTFKSGVNTKLNKLLDPSGSIKSSLFFENYESLEARDRLIEIPQPIIETGDYFPQFQAAVSHYLQDDIFDKIAEQNVGSEVGVYGRTVDGAEILIVGRIRQKSPSDITKEKAAGTPEDQIIPYSFYTTRGEPLEPPPIPYKRELTEIPSGAELANIQKPASFDVGHSKAESTQIMEKKLKLIKETLDLAKRDNNTNTIQYLESIIPALEKIINRAKAVDKIYAAQSAITSRAYGPEFNRLIELAAGLGADEVLIVESTGGATITTRTVKVPFEFSASIFTSEISRGNQGFKSGRQNSLKSQFEKVIAGILDAGAIDMFTEERSSSILHMAILKGLSNIFNDPSFEKLIKKPKRRVRKNSTKIRTSEKIDTKQATEGARKNKERIKRNIKLLKQSPPGYIARKAHSPKNPKKKSPEIAKPDYSGTPGMVTMMNNILYQFILRQMVYPALVNRTGRFAKSVKITNITDRGALFYAYQRSPYQIFSQKRGKFPWNAQAARDPDRIIKAAIREMIAQRFPGYFKSISTIEEVYGS